MPPARKLLYIYLFTSPHTNNLGVLNTTARRIAFETGMSEEEVSTHLNVLEQQDGKIALDGVSGGSGGSCGSLSILVVNFIKHQCTTSPKLVMSLRALFRGVESEKIKAVLIAKNPHLLDGMDRVPDTVSIPSGEIDQDQIQEKREEIRSFPCGGDEERGKRGRQGKGNGIAAPLPPPQQLNMDTPKKSKRSAQYADLFLAASAQHGHPEEGQERVRTVYAPFLAATVHNDDGGGGIIRLTRPPCLCGGG